MNGTRVDSQSGLVHTVKATSANVHDVRMTLELLHGEEETLNGDSGYIGAEKREDAIIRNKKGKKIRYQINRRPSQIRKLSKSGQHRAKKREHAKSTMLFMGRLQQRLFIPELMQKKSLWGLPPFLEISQL